MRQTVVTAALVGGMALGAFLLLQPAPSPAEAAKESAIVPAAKSASSGWGGTAGAATCPATIGNGPVNAGSHIDARRGRSAAPRPRTTTVSARQRSRPRPPDRPYQTP